MGLHVGTYQSNELHTFAARRRGGPTLVRRPGYVDCPRVVFGWSGHKQLVEILMVQECQKPCGSIRRFHALLSAYA